MTAPCRRLVAVYTRAATEPTPAPDHAAVVADVAAFVERRGWIVEPVTGDCSITENATEGSR